MICDSNPKDNDITNDTTNPYGIALTEEDEPICSIKDNNSGLAAVQLEPEQYIKENEKERAEKRYYKSFNLIFICLGIIVFMYVFDFVAYAITEKTSDNFGGILEAVKALLFSVSGYLFAERNKGKD